MRRQSISVATIVALSVLVPSGASAEPTIRNFENGNRLLEVCDRPEAEREFCRGYVAGVMDALAQVSADTGMPPFVCRPQGLVPSQIADVAVNYIKAHPETRHTGAAGLVINAAAAAFPCKT